MARKDYYHDTVRRALEKDGWTITSEPLFLKFIGLKPLEIDFGADKIEIIKGNRKIAVEVKNFISPTEHVNEYHRTLGQMANYMGLLADQDPGRVAYLAITEDAYNNVFLNKKVQATIKLLGIKLVVFNPTSETITKWDA